MMFSYEIYFFSDDSTNKLFNESEYVSSDEFPRQKDS